MQQLVSLLEEGRAILGSFEETRLALVSRSPDAVSVFDRVEKRKRAWENGLVRWKLTLKAGSRKLKRRRDVIYNLQTKVTNAFLSLQDLYCTEVLGRCSRKPTPQPVDQRLAIAMMSPKERVAHFKSTMC